MIFELRNGDIVRVRDNGITAPEWAGRIGVVIDDIDSHEEVKVLMCGRSCWWHVDSLEAINEPD